MTLPRPHQVKPGYAVRDETGRYGVVVGRGTTRNAWTGNVDIYVDVCWQDNQTEGLFLADLLEIHDHIELLGPYRAASRSKGKPGGSVTFSVGGERQSSHPSYAVLYAVGEAVPKVADFVAFWKARCREDAALRDREAQAPAPTPSAEGPVVWPNGGRDEHPVR